MDTKKTEKLVSALYLLTSFFADKEPMKWRIRELGGELLSHKEGSNIVSEIRSLLAVARNAALISDTNFDIIDKEFSLLVPGSTFEGLLASVREERDALVPKAVPTLGERREEKQNVESSHTKREERTYYLDTPVVRQAIKDRADKPKEPKQAGTVALKKNNRQNIILNLLKRKKEIQIADVSPLIPGVSEKTIQRELLSMVAAGILSKIGEKRWSRYTLAEE